ncbi:glycoside hydrolase family 10 protein [Paludisphaera soli]|uniref:glycoside hydrolase family 10 protein n=1 Tax=Paludisphaera soli TaxID=2712865 RepID=UPI0013E9E649|nr:family 10 glycosylhydrolase [Paludisphaera soli]
MSIAPLLACCLLAAAPPAAAEEGAKTPPPIPREFRAAWVATVANIDWPSKPGLSTEVQQQEARAILDRLAKSNFNAVVFQVRPAADALYASELEPWSYYLTGTQGKAPEPYYDPLQFWIDEAHARGMQLHAWFNPFRAKQAGGKYEAAASHVSKARPDLVRSYGDLLWMDPGEPDARAQTLGVILDVVRRYDVDGIHFDDYFYPYPVADPKTKAEIDFPDDESWKRHHKADDPADRGDWRRANMTQLIRDLYDGIKKAKPHVLFGISPFGIPRPGKPAGVVGFDQYAKLYADTESWLQSGWIDYWTPQLYWKIDAPGQPFRPLLNYWISINAKARHVWPGLTVSRIGRQPGEGYAPEEILNQIKIIREAPGEDGVVLFSMKPLLQDRQGIATTLAEGLFREPSLIPAFPWLGDKVPAGPIMTINGGNVALASGPGGEPAALWVVQLRKGDAWTTRILPASAPLTLPAADGLVAFGVSRTGIAGPPVRSNLAKP